MKNCTHCKYAEWKLAADGKLHRSGEGQCKYPWKMPPLPASMFWVGQRPPEPCGGYISRKEDLKDNCVYFTRNSTYDSGEGQNG